MYSQSRYKPALCKIYARRRGSFGVQWSAREDRLEEQKKIAV